MAVATIKCDEIYTTDQGIELIEKYITAFGKIKKVEMKGSFINLINESGYNISMYGVFSCGYAGGGPSGTYDLFQRLGINVSKEFIYENEEFMFKIK